MQKAWHGFGGYIVEDSRFAKRLVRGQERGAQLCKVLLEARGLSELDKMRVDRMFNAAFECVLPH